MGVTTVRRLQLGSILPSAGWGSRAVALALSWLIIPLSIEALAWQGLAVGGGPGLDPSWQAGLEMAMHMHFTFGKQILFTYGPLGVLTIGNAAGQSAFWFSQLAVISVLSAVLLRFVLSAALFHAARRTYGAFGAFLLSVVGVSIAGPAFPDLSIVIIALVWGIGSRLSPRGTLLLAAIASAVAAVELLEKVSLGVTALAMVAVYTLVAPVHGRRTSVVVTAAGVYLSVLVVFWLALDQSLSGLPTYIYGSYQIAAGFSAAMSSAQLGYGWTFTPAILLGVCGLYAAWRTSDGLPTRERAGVMLLWLLFWFSAFKEGFVREDAAHVPIFFGAMVGGLFAFRMRRGDRKFALLSLALAVCAWLASVGVTFTQVVDPTRNASAMYADVRDVVSQHRLDALLNAARERVKTTEPLSEHALSLVRNHTVAVYPSEIAIAWAYRLDWRPLPVLQGYVAYTTWLDRLDANFVRSARAPQRLIVQAGPTTIDGRIFAFDEPYTTMQIYCRYRPQLLSKTYAILRRGHDRCSAPRPLKTVRAQWGRPVAVPKPPGRNSIVLGEITGIKPTGFALLGGALFKPAVTYISINGQAFGRLIAATAADGLPLAASRGVDLPVPFSITPEATTIAVAQGLGTQPGGRDAITYRFYAVRVRATPMLRSRTHG